MKATTEEKKGFAPTDAQIKEWKEKYGEIFQITIDDKNGIYRKPDRKILSMAMKHVVSDPMKFNDILAKNCWLAGDTEFQNNEEFFLAAAAKFGELVETKDAEIKKL